jgi:hypothetical protein
MQELIEEVSELEWKRLKRKESLTVLRRLISYGEKIFCLSTTLVAPLGDRRLDPRRSTSAVVKAALVMFWTRLPSLNALAQISAPRFWKQWLHQPLASADTLGRVHAALHADQLGKSIFLVYQQLKRNKASARSSGHGPGRAGRPREPCQLPATLCRLPAAHHP